MKYIKGNNRNQTTFFCLEQAIEKDNEVRLIDLFVDGLTLRNIWKKTQKVLKRENCLTNYLTSK